MSFIDITATNEIDLSLKYTRIVKWGKILLAVCLCAIYFLKKEMLVDFLVLSSIVCLMLPLGFFDVFIQKLLEYNTRKVEERQILNAGEANHHFERSSTRIKLLEERIELLEEKVFHYDAD